MKLNIKYEWYHHQKPILSVLNDYKKNKRKIKRFLKLKLSMISKTLDNSDWNVTFYFWGLSPDVSFLHIDIKAYNKKIKGVLKLINDKENSSDFSDFSSNLTLFLEILKEQKNLKNFYFIIDDFPLNDENHLTFNIIEEDRITTFKNKHEGFLKNIHNNEYFIFDDYYFSLQLFFISDEIYWRSTYCLNPRDPDYLNRSFTKVRSIKEDDEKDFIISMIETNFINVVDDVDIEEILSWSVKDIFAMSKLLGY